MFDAAERKIYGPYDRGDGVHVWADPVATRRELVHQLGGDLDQVLADYHSPAEPQAYAATKALAAATVAALGLMPFSPETGCGLTEDEVLAELGRFFDFEEAKKKSVPTSSTPTSSPPSPRGPSPAAGRSTSSTPAGSPGNDCGCG